MKKSLLYILAILVVFVQVSPLAFSKTTQSPALKLAIKKYQRGNYTGCLQDCQSIVKYDPKNAVAYYYMAMAYVQAGKKDEAIANYNKVLGLNINSQLRDYASTGKRCIETPDQCHPDQGKEDSTDLDRFIANPDSSGMSDSVKRNFDSQRLQNIKQDINNGREIDNYKLRKFEDFSSQLQDEQVVAKIAENKPSEQEIQAAMKVLKDAGINPYTQASDVNYQDPQMAQLNMLMGGNNSVKTNNSIDMIPMMMYQNKSGQNISPQVMQAIIMNSMMSDFNVNVDTDK